MYKMNEDKCKMQHMAFIWAATRSPVFRKAIGNSAGMKEWLFHPLSE